MIGFPMGSRISFCCFELLKDKGTYSHKPLVKDSDQCLTQEDIPQSLAPIEPSLV